METPGKSIRSAIVKPVPGTMRDTMANVWQASVMDGKDVTDYTYGGWARTPDGRTRYFTVIVWAPYAEGRPWEVVSSRGGLCEEVEREHRSFRGFDDAAEWAESEAERMRAEIVTGRDIPAEVGVEVA